jgi:hypothetical protein
MCLVTIFLFQILAELKPKGLKVVGGMSFVRNSVGEGKQDFREKYSYDLSPTEI